MNKAKTLTADETLEQIWKLTQAEEQPELVLGAIVLKASEYFEQEDTPSQKSELPTDDVITEMSILYNDGDLKRYKKGMEYGSDYKGGLIDMRTEAEKVIQTLLEQKDREIKELEESNRDWNEVFDFVKCQLAEQKELIEKTAIGFADWIELEKWTLLGKDEKSGKWVKEFPETNSRQELTTAELLTEYNKEK